VVRSCRTGPPTKQSLTRHVGVRFAGPETAAAVGGLVVRRGFKALKQTVKLHYRLGNFEAMMTSYRDMLTYIK
jgi:hypothetical protein